MKELTKVQVIRRRNLQLLIDRHGSVATLGQALGYKSGSRVSHMLGSVGMSEKVARDIEARLKLADGWLDGDADGARPNMPNTEWLVDICMVIAQSVTAKKFDKKKRDKLIVFAYSNAEQRGAVDVAEVNKLIALAE